MGPGAGIRRGSQGKAKEQAQERGQGAAAGAVSDCKAGKRRKEKLTSDGKAAGKRRKEKLTSEQKEEARAKRKRASLGNQFREGMHL